MSKSIDELEEELSRVPSFIKPFLMLATVITAIICLPYLAIKILSAPEDEEDQS